MLQAVKYKVNYDFILNSLLFFTELYSVNLFVKASFSYLSENEIAEHLAFHIIIDYYLYTFKKYLGE